MADAEKPTALNSTLVKHGPLKVTLFSLCLYLFAGSSYIIYSSLAASHSAGSVDELKFIETVKGLCFVFVSGSFFSVLLHALLQRLKSTYDQIAQRNLQLQEHNLRLQVTELELREEKARAEDKSAGKSRFLALISHEIRTPVHTILAAAELMDAEGADEYAEIVRNAAATLSDLVNRLLDYSALEGGVVELWPERFDVFREIRLLSRPFTVLAACKSQIFTCEVPEQCTVIGDRLRFGQVLRNLIDNAVKYTPDGGRVSLRALYSDETGRIKIEVSDSGPGIGPADKARIFEPFIQVDSGPARRHGGAGLGLAISRELVELAGGTLTVADGKHGGAVFTMEIPLTKSGPIEEIPAGYAAQSALRVLVVEDNRVNLLLAERLLRKLGHIPTGVVSGADALIAFERSDYDVVLLDLEMPEMNGLETAQKLRQIEALENRRHTQIIALTAYESSAHRDACESAGFNGFVAKPASLAEISKILSGVRAKDSGVTIKQTANA